MLEDNAFSQLDPHEDNQNSIIKEMALIKVLCDIEKRAEILQIVEHFACKTVDLTKNSLVIQATGNSDKLDAMIQLMRDYKIVELVRTGKVLMARGDEET